MTDDSRDSLMFLLAVVDLVNHSKFFLLVPKIGCGDLHIRVGSYHLIKVYMRLFHFM